MNDFPVRFDTLSIVDAPEFNRLLLAFANARTELSEYLNRALDLSVMPKEAASTDDQNSDLYFGHLTPKQLAFCKAESRYVMFGGARGGGKSHALRIKAIAGAKANPGLRILFLCDNFPTLDHNVI